MKVLGIESSCDDTGIALIENDQIISNIVLKQEHRYGVIPEYAARAHHSALFEHAKIAIGDSKNVDLIAYTAGPGLIGSLFVGACFAKGLAYASGIPSIGVNHLEGHVILPYWMNRSIAFPYLCMLVSGGHTMIILVKELGEYEILARTLDDAVGEVFDKIARHIGLEYPGGPNIEKFAMKYDANDCAKFNFPNSMHNRDDFSFSGLKTAALRQIEAASSDEEKAAFCWQLQNHIANMLVHKMEHWHNLIANTHNIRDWVISGGVAANKTIRAKFGSVADRINVHLDYPPIEYCTDNGLMIAALGQMRFAKYGASDWDQKIAAQMPLDK